MRIYGRRIDVLVEDVVGAWSTGWVELGGRAHALGDLVIGARRVAAHAQTADSLVLAIERQASRKSNAAPANSADASRLARRRQTLGIERVARSNSEERMAWLAQRI